MAKKVASKIVESYCLKCGRLHGLDEFYKSKNNNHSSGVLPYCRVACNEILNEYLQKTGSLEVSLWLLCADCGVPFKEKAYKSVTEKLEQLNKDKKTPKEKYFGMYMSALQANSSKGIFNYDFSQTDVSKGDIGGVAQSEMSIEKQIKEFQLTWGNQEEIEDYIFLEERWDFYTEGGKMILAPAQDTLYRDLCLLELTKRKAEEKSTPTEKTRESIIKVMDKLGITKFEQKQDKTKEEALIEKQAWEHENFKPCEIIDLNVYKDACNIEKNWFNHVLRAVINLLTGKRDYPKLANFEKNEMRNDSRYEETS